MPITFEERVSPSGRPYVRVYSHGKFSLDDAKAYVTNFSKGGPYYLKHVLSIVEQGTDYAADARKHLFTMGDSGPLASVTTSSLMRAAVNLMIRFSGRRGTFRMFTDEAEALAWLERQEVSNPAPK